MNTVQTIIALSFFGGAAVTIIVVGAGIALVAKIKGPPNDDWWRDRNNWGG